MTDRHCILDTTAEYDSTSRHYVRCVQEHALTISITASGGRGVIQFL